MFKMFKRILPMALLASAALLSPASAQFDPNATPTPEQQQLMQQLQSARDQAVQNMQNQGIDPQQFAQDMQQQMQNGTLDPAAMQQMLVDRGIISQDMITQLQGTVKSAALASIRQQLGSTDDEWAVVQPKIQRVVTAMSDVDPNGLGRLAGRVFNPQAGTSDMDKARAELKTAVADQNVSVERLNIVLTNWRNLHEKAKIELNEAQADLTRILTLRQEAILLGIGVL